MDEETSPSQCRALRKALYELLLLLTRRVCVCVCVCVCQREREREKNRVTVESAVLTAACVLQIHTSFITVSVTRLCSPFGLELMVKLRTLLTVFTFILKAEACDYGKGRYISEACLWCSANHNASTVSAGQSEQTALVGRRGFVENDVFERGGA